MQYSKAAGGCPKKKGSLRMQRAQFPVVLLGGLQLVAVLKPNISPIGALMPRYEHFHFS